MGPRLARRVEAPPPIACRGWRAGGLALLLAAALGAGAAAADDEGIELYVWVDSGGVVRYTPNPGRVPALRRGSMQRVEPGMTVVQPPRPPPPEATAAVSALTSGVGVATSNTSTRVVPAPSTPVMGAPAEPGSLSATPPRLPEGASTGSEDAYRPDPFNEPGTIAAVESEALPVASAPARPVSSRPAQAVSSPPSARAVEQPPEPPAPELATRIEELERAIALDEEALKQLISEAHVEGSDPILESEELREIARRLPALQSDLRALREQRAQQSAP